MIDDEMDEIVRVGSMRLESLAAEAAGDPWLWERHGIALVSCHHDAVAYVVDGVVGLDGALGALWAVERKNALLDSGVAPSVAKAQAFAERKMATLGQPVVSQRLSMIATVLRTNPYTPGDEVLRLVEAAMEVDLPDARS